MARMEADGSRGPERPSVPAGGVPATGRGALIWLVAQQERSAAGLREVAARLCGLRAGLGALVLHADHLAPPTEQPGVSGLAFGADRPARWRALMQEAPPDVVVVSGERLMPGLLKCAREAGVPVIVTEAREPVLPRSWSLWPRLARDLLRSLHCVFLDDGATASDWTQRGTLDVQVRAAGALARHPGALICNEAEQRAMAQALQLRPVWLAAGLPQSELDAVLDAHRAALRLSHRLLLIVHPDLASEGPELRRAIAQRFTTALRSVDESIVRETQVYVADTEGERGLWYRLAPASFMGGSLSPGGSRLNPMEAAALGSALVHGGAEGQFGPAYRDLAAAQATLRIARPQMLEAAVCRLLDPEQAAQLASRAWGVASAGAEATDLVLRAILDALSRDIRKPG